ncbi:ComEC/Rec2 family competence protein [Brevibacillus massiliensis]|uniref:ComEC/Rec2 family competence protein n=1 Tax=Brevibacillus massiliensis TaxID=1118054 RepID=UPI0002D90889|nr:hypothetical protein [Brevibacillus massiliensis]
MRKSMPNPLVLMLFVVLVLSSCSIGSHLKKAVKVDDPFSAENERNFSGMVVTFFSLPDGESTLIRLPGGKKLLVDTGSSEDAEVLRSLLEERRVTKIDFVMLTNDQSAQAGGYAELAKTMQIDSVLLPKLTYATVLQAVPIQPDKKLVLLSAGDQYTLDESVVLTVLNPSEPLFLSPQDNSIVFSLKQDKLHYLFTSGVGEKAEERLLDRYPQFLPAEVLKVADQGSNQASSQPFLTKVDAQVAVIQTGKAFDQLKPGQAEIMERLGESWAETYVTSQRGTITVLSNGREYKVIEVEKKPKGG